MFLLYSQSQKMFLLNVHNLIFLLKIIFWGVIHQLKRHTKNPCRYSLSLERKHPSSGIKWSVPKSFSTYE